MLKNITSKKRKGFTLVELIVVIVILGILAGLVISKISDKTIKAQIAAEEANTSTAIRNINISMVESPEKAIVATTAAADLTGLGKTFYDSFQNVSTASNAFIVYKPGTTATDGFAYSYLLTGTNADSKAYIKNIASALDKKFDNEDGETAGKYRYEDDCTTAETNGSDCYAMIKAFESDDFDGGVNDEWFTSAPENGISTGLTGSIVAGATDTDALFLKLN